MRNTKRCPILGGGGGGTGAGFKVQEASTGLEQSELRLKIVPPPLFASRPDLHAIIQTINWLPV